MTLKLSLPTFDSSPSAIAGAGSACSLPSLGGLRSASVESERSSSPSSPIIELQATSEGVRVVSSGKLLPYPTTDLKEATLPEGPLHHFLVTNGCSIESAKKTERAFLTIMSHLKAEDGQHIILQDSGIEILLREDEVTVFQTAPFVVGGEKTVHSALTMRKEGEENTAVLRSQTIAGTSVTTKQHLCVEDIRARFFHKEAKDDSRAKYIMSPYLYSFQEEAHVICLSKKYKGDFLLLLSPEISSKARIKALTEACYGLALMHERGFVHNDIALNNFFLSDDRCVVGDLANSRKAEGPFPEGLVLRNDPACYGRYDDKTPYDVFCLAEAFKVLVQSYETLGMADDILIITLKELIPSMQKEDPTERITMSEVVSKMQGLIT